MSSIVTSPAVFPYSSMTIGHMIAVLLHLTKQIVDRLGLGNEANGRTSSRTRLVHALRVVQFEHIPDVDEAENLVDVSSYTGIRENCS